MCKLLKNCSRVCDTPLKCVDCIEQAERINVPVLIGNVSSWSAFLSICWLLFIRFLLCTAPVPRMAQLGDTGNCVFFLFLLRPSKCLQVCAVCELRAFCFLHVTFFLVCVSLVSCRFMGIQCRTSWWSRAWRCRLTSPCTRLPWTGSSSAFPTTPPR